MTRIGELTTTTDPTGQYVATENIAGENNRKYDISLIKTNNDKITTIEQDQITQNEAIALNTEKVGLSAQQVIDLGNLSGTNTGDQDLSGLALKNGDSAEDFSVNNLTALGTLSGSNLSGTNTGDQDLSNFVPYIGANSNLNLGDYSFRALQFLSKSAFSSTLPYAALFESDTYASLFLRSNESLLHSLTLTSTNISSYLRTSFASSYAEVQSSSGSAYLKVSNGTNISTYSASSAEVDGTINATGEITGSNLSGTNTGDQDLSSFATIASVDLKEDLANKGVSNGYAELDSSGKVPASQLPAFVDDVLEFDSLLDFPVSGESGVIYIALDTNLTYRWSGSNYTAIGNSLALGETSSSAYRGDRGKLAYDHTLLTNNPHSVTKAQIGLSDVDNTADAYKVVSIATQTALDLKYDKSGGTISGNVIITGSTTLVGIDATGHINTTKDVSALATRLTGVISSTGLNGTGVEIQHSGTIGRILSYDRTNNVGTRLDIDASIINYMINGIIKSYVDSTGYYISSNAYIGSSGVPVRINSTTASGIVELNGTTENVIRATAGTLALQTNGANTRLSIDSAGDITIANSLTANYGTFNTGIKVNSAVYEAIVAERSTIAGVAVEYKNSIGRLGRAGFDADGTYRIWNNADTNAFSITTGGNLNSTGTASFGGNVTIASSDYIIDRSVTSGVFGTRFYRSAIERGRVAFDYATNELQLQADGEMKFYTGGENLALTIGSTGNITAAGSFTFNGALFGLSGELYLDGGATYSPATLYRQDSVTRGRVDYRNSTSSMRLLCNDGNSELWANDTQILVASSTGVAVTGTLSAKSADYEVITVRRDHPSNGAGIDFRNNSGRLGRTGFSAGNYYIHNASDTTILSITDAGNLTASGSGTFINGDIKLQSNVFSDAIFPSDFDTAYDTNSLGLARNDGTITHGISAYNVNSITSHTSYHSRFDHVFMGNINENMRLDFDGNLTVSRSGTFGNSAKIEPWSIVSTFARVGHKDWNISDNYGLLQDSAGETWLRGTELRLKSGSGNIDIASAMTVSGNIYASGEIRCGNDNQFLVSQNTAWSSAYQLVFKASDTIRRFEMHSGSASAIELELYNTSTGDFNLIVGGNIYASGNIQTTGKDFTLEGSGTLSGTSSTQTISLESHAVYIISATMIGSNCENTFCGLVTTASVNVIAGVSTLNSVGFNLGSLDIQTMSGLSPGIYSAGNGAKAQLIFNAVGVTGTTTWKWSAKRLH